MPSSDFFWRGANLQRGFAYLWLLISVSLVGLALSTTMQLDSLAARRDQEKELIAIGQQFRSAIRSYRERPGLPAGLDSYPTSLQDLTTDSRSNSTKRHLRKVFTDPITGRTDWGLVMLNGKIVGVHSVSSMKPIKEDGFSEEDGSFRGAQSYSQWVFSAVAP
jgi:type II secretory pathway pseudopilin PulG